MAPGLMSYLILNIIHPLSSIFCFVFLFLSHQLSFIIKHSGQNFLPCKQGSEKASKKQSNVKIRMCFKIELAFHSRITKIFIQTICLN